MQRLTLLVTPEDAREAARFKISDPFLFVLQRTTGTLWRASEDGAATEIMAPHRSCRLTGDSLRRRQEYSQAYSQAYSQESSVGGAAAWSQTPLELELESDCEFENLGVENLGVKNLGAKQAAKDEAACAAKAPKSTQIELCIAPDEWPQSGDDLETLLLAVLQRRTATPWRAVCPSVFVERVEPYNTAVLSAAVLKELREQQAVGATRSGARRKSHHFTAQLHAPLATVPGDSSKVGSEPNLRKTGTILEDSQARRQLIF